MGSGPPRRLEVENMTLENVFEIAVLVAIVVVAIRFFCEAGLISHVFLEHHVGASASVAVVSPSGSCR